MLTKYDDSKSVQVINGYYVDIHVGIDGTVNIFDRVSGDPILVTQRKNSRGEDELNINFASGNYWVKVATLVNMAFKGKKGYIEYMVRRGLEYVDGNVDNLHPSNLIWTNDPPIQTLGGFRLIPGFSRYYINKRGDVYNTETQKLQVPYVDQSGYIMFGVTPDIGNRAIVGQHRLLALAWLPYPVNVDKLYVNHIDGIKANNQLDNLEWITSAGNNHHAIDTGLRNKEKRVLVRRVLTGEVEEYPTVQATAKALNITPGAVVYRCQNNGKVVYEDGTQLKYNSSTVPWRIPDNPQAEIDGAQKNVRIKLTNTKTNEVQYFDMQKDAAEYMGLSKKYLNKLVKKKGYPLIFGPFEIDKG